MEKSDDQINKGNFQAPMSQSEDESLCKQKITSIQQAIKDVKAFSSEKRLARRQKMYQYKKQEQKRQLYYEEQLTKILASPPFPNYKRQSLGGLVVQVPENTELTQTDANPYAQSSSTYLVSEILKGYKDPKSAVRQHLTSSLQILKTLEKSKMPTKQQIKHRMLNLQVKPECKGLKTIAFDLDQTLIHCNESTSMSHDIIIRINFPTGETVQAGINIRPGAIQLLQLLKGKYQVMIFTASHSCYANQILNYLDPHGDLIQHRMYRQSCHISNEGYFVKDLRIIGRNLKDLLLVDNAAYCYAYQLDNGVPILPYFSGKNDYELKALGQYLISLQGESQLRAPNQRLFKLNRYLQFYGKVEALVEELYM